MSLDARRSPFFQALLASQDAPQLSGSPSRPRAAPGWGAMRCTVLALAAAAVLLAGLGSAWWVSHNMRQQTLERAMARQADEVDTVARMLAARLEQQQRLLWVLAQGIADQGSDPSRLMGEMLRGDASVRLFDTLQLADARGQLQLSLRGGRSEPLVDLDEGVRDVMRRSLADGRPVVSTMVRKGADPGMMELLYAVPLRTGNGTVSGVLSAGVRMSAQALLPPSIDPSRSGGRLLVMQRDGQILAHSDPSRWSARAEAEPGLGADWLQDPAAGAVQVGPDTQRRAGYLVTTAGMPLPQWLVVRITPEEAIAPSLAPRVLWWLLAAVAGVAGLLVLLLILVTEPMAALHRTARQWLASQGRLMAEEPDPAPEPEPGHAEEGGWRMPWTHAWGEASTLWQALHRLGQMGQEQAHEVGRLQLQLQTLMDYAPVGLVVTRSAHLELVGLQAARMLGYPPRELQGQAIRQLCASDAAHIQLLERVRKDLDMYGQFDSEQCFVRKDGRPIWVRLHGQSLQRLQRGLEPRAVVPADPTLVWVVEDVTMQRLVREQPGWKAMHDPLTLLPNREAFAMRLHEWLQECSAAQRLPAEALQQGESALLQSENTAVATVEEAQEAEDEAVGLPQHGVILFLDLDHFAHVNQQGGHAAGDEVLCHMARLIDSVVRPLGWVARLGGDEFAVLLAGTSAEQGMLLAQSLCMAVQDWEGAHEGQRYLMGVSVGMVVLDARQHTVSSALRSADMACYAAKRKGRNRVEVLEAA
ncbi:sensor domain-containing diguanylate cyclase [Delftia acidovorans]|uniref:sensor domain-containing diguanylate cyclase n=1 Tax=Delftia acidovorans TaxID=80866 RepID=UPI000BC3154C|nr:diguanylate cyclase [Delftia acidovorans]ATH14198.1 sensor domain-containing diguanylate cyclase [Delftia acidovorans]